MRNLCLSIGLALAIAATPVLAPRAVAKSSGSSSAHDLERLRQEQERQRQQQERAREQARQERERAREQARQERERERQERQQQREQARLEREQARQEREAQRQQKASQQKAAKPDNEDDDDRPAAAGASTPRTSAQEKTAETSKSQKAAAKDDDEDDGDRSSSGRAAATTGTAAGKKDTAKANRKPEPDTSEPPATVAEWLKRLGYSTDTGSTPAPSITDSTSRSTAKAVTPPAGTSSASSKVGQEQAGQRLSGDAKTQTKTAKDQAANPPNDKTTADKNALEKSQTASKATRRPPPPAGDPLAMPRAGEARSNQLLAVGMSQEAIEVAQKSGIVVTSTFSKPGAPPVTQLTLPKDMPPHVARDLLRGSLPPDAFALNRVYRHHHHLHLPPPHQHGLGPAPPPAPNATATASGPTPAAPLALPGVVAESGKQCTLARCFAPRLIGWQDTLAACTVGTRIGVIDTSVERRHPALADARIIERAFTPSGSQPSVDGHGTSVLALLAGDAKSGTPGLAPKAEYLVANVFGSDTNGKPVSDTFSLLKAIDWLHRNSVPVVNISLAGPHDPLLQKAITDYSSKGMMFVAAAGNEGPGAAPSYPAAYPEVIAVTAVDKDLRSYRHANRGTYIDVAAPGVGVWTALPQAKAGPMSGTSFATPHVTAMIASVHAGATDRSKQGLLSLFSTQDLGPAGPDPIYGRGLILAPSSCRPGGGSSIAATGGWGTTVVPAGLTRSR